MAERVQSCGVLVTAAERRLLLGQATGTPRWDIPKGVAEPGEAAAAAARRELLEETWLEVAEAALVPLGQFDYLPGKDLTLFAWRPTEPIDPALLRCSSLVRLRNGRDVPELARFGLFAWDEALGRVGKSLARVLAAIGPERALQ